MQNTGIQFNAIVTQPSKQINLTINYSRGMQ